jgi:RPA family protein
MMDRLQIILQSDGEYTKEEINDFVFNGKKPKKKKNDKLNKTEENYNKSKIENYSKNEEENNNNVENNGENNDNN